MVQPQVWWGMEIAGCWEGVYYHQWAALMCIIATCWGNMLWGSLCISSLVPLKHSLYPEENTPGVQIHSYTRDGSVWSNFAASMIKALKHPQGTWAFNRIHRAETKPGIAGLRRDLSGYLRWRPIAQKGNCMYKNISRELPVHITVLAIPASRDFSSRKAMALQCLEKPFAIKIRLILYTLLLLNCLDREFLTLEQTYFILQVVNTRFTCDAGACVAVGIWFPIKYGKDFL